MGVSKAVPATRAGRPRRFEAEDELRLLLDAALAVMERNGYVDAAVADILREADLSTRSFYRHFESKDQLLCALYRREAEAAAVRLHAKVEAAPSPRAALDAWIDEILSFGHHRTKAARVAVLGSPGAMRAEGYAEETRHAAKLLMAPLEALLAAGAADGSFPLADPTADAPLVQSVAWAAAGLNPTRDKLPRAEASRQVRSFCERALGRDAASLSRLDGEVEGQPRSVGERPRGGLAVLDPDDPVDLEHPEVRHGLAHRGPAHEAGDVVPRPRPLHVRRDLPGGVRPVPQDGDHLAEAVPVVLAKLLEPGLQRSSKRYSCAGRTSPTR